MRLLMENRIFTVSAASRFATVLVMLISATSAIAAPPAHRPLPPQVVSQAPEMRPLGKGRHSWWGVQMYDATLWIVGPQWSAAGTHALDLEPSRVVPADTLVKNAIKEMRDLKVGDESKLKTWQAELTKVIPNVRPGDQIVIFCPDTNRTLIYLNDSSNGEVDDPSFCPAIMSVWLHPQTKHQAMRKSLLRQ
jgi:Chalcone isomerase-like